MRLSAVFSALPRSLGPRVARWQDSRFGLMKWTFREESRTDRSRRFEEIAVAKAGHENRGRNGAGEAAVFDIRRKLTRFRALDRKFSSTHGREMAKPFW